MASLSGDQEDRMVIDIFRLQAANMAVVVGGREQFHGSCSGSWPFLAHRYPVRPLPGAAFYLCRRGELRATPQHSDVGFKIPGCGSRFPGNTKTDAGLPASAGSIRARSARECARGREKHLYDTK